MSIEYKSNIAARVPVTLTLSAGGPHAGAVAADVTATVQKSDGTQVAIAMSGANWSELSTGAFSGAGQYSLIIPYTAMDVTGPLVYAVAVAGCTVFVGLIKVVAQEEADTFAAVASVSTQAGLDAVNENVAALDARIQIAGQDVFTLYKLQYGRMQIHAVGDDAYRMVMYDEDGTTPLLKFDLKDVSGNPSYKAVFQRVPV